MRLSSPWSPVEIRQPVAAPRDAVFNALADPETYPEWLVGAQRIRAVDREFPAPGAKFDHSVGPAKSATVDDATEVIEAHGHRQLVLEAHVGPVAAEVEFDLIKRGDDRTEVVMRERPIGVAAVFTPLVRPLLALRNMQSMRQFAQYVARA
jgi:uncharacterized protein YndB with AHSA1/START domain